MFEKFSKLLDLIRLGLKKNGKFQIIEEDEANLTDGRGSNGSQHEKDSGISRTTDSEGEFANGVGISLTPSPPLPSNPPPVRPPPKSASRFSQESFTTTASTTVVGSGNEISSPATEFHRTAVSSAMTSAVTTPSEAPRLYRSESEGSLARELAHLHREMQNIQLECDRLVDRYAKQEQRVRLQVEKANEWMSNLDVVDPPPLPPPKKSPAGGPAPFGSTPFGQAPFGQAPFSQAPFGQAPFGSAPFGQAPFGQAPFGAQKPLAAVQRLREETSSAYNTGDSCRSTPLHNKNNQNNAKLFENIGIVGNTKESLMKKSPVVTFSPQPPVRKAPYDNNSFLRIKKIDKASGKSPPAMRQIPSQVPAQVPGHAPSHQIPSSQHVQSSHQIPTHHVQSQLQSFPFTVGDIMYTDVNNLQYTMQLQHRLLRQAMLDQAKQLKSDELWGQGPVSSQKLYSGGESSENVEWKVRRKFFD